MAALDLAVWLDHVRTSRIRSAADRSAGGANVVLKLLPWSERDHRGSIHGALHLDCRVRRRYIERVAILEQEVVGDAGVAQNIDKVDTDSRRGFARRAKTVLKGLICDAGTQSRRRSRRS